MAAEVRLHPRSPPRVSSFLLRLLPITRKGEGYPCQALPPCSGHHERLVPGWWHPSARGQPGSAAAAKALESTKPGLSPTAEMGKSAHPEAPFHGERRDS